MRYKFIMILFLIPFAPSAQVKQRMALSFGGNTSYTNFKAFENYLSTYNAANQNRPGFEAAKYNPLGFGYEGEFEYLLGGFYTGFRLSKYSSQNSVGKLTEGQRFFQLRSLCTDLKVGFMTKKGFSMYFAMGIHSFNLVTHFRYPNGMESYGSDKYINGVYHSFKMQGIFGMRYEKDFKKLGFYIDVCAPVNAKNSQDGFFNKNKANSWETAFPQDHSNYNSASSVALPQIYRNIRAGAGIVFYLSKKEL